MRLPITLPCPGSRRFVVQGPIALSTQLPFRTLDCESCRAEGCIARVEKHEPSSCNGSRCIPRIIRQITRWPLPESDAMFDPSNGWFLPELARNLVCQSLFDPSDGWFCPNLLEIRSAKPCLVLPTGGFCPSLLEIRSAKPCLILPTGGFCPNLLEIRSAKRRLILVSSQPRIRAQAEPVVHALRECVSAASGFVFPEITVAIQCEMILWLGKERCALECAASPRAGRLTRSAPVCAAGLGKARRRSELSRNGDYG